MLSHPNLYKTPPNPYLIKCDGTTVVFRTPLWRTLLLLFIEILFCAAGSAIFVGLAKLGGFDFVPGLMIQGMLYVSGFCVLGCGICLMLSTGAGKITFDLQRRTYSSIFVAPAPLFGSRYPDAAGMGNPFARRVVAGPMSEIAGVQVVERGNSSARACSVYVVFSDQSVFPCVVYYSNSLLDAQAQLQHITSLLSLAALKTLLISDPKPLPASYRRSPVRNPYLARRDQRTAVFRTPRWRTVLSLSLAGFLCGLPLYGMILSMERWGKPNVILLIEGLPIIVFGIFIALSSGANEIAFDLKDRSYRRVLLPLPAITGAKSRNLTGIGNPLAGRTINGEMSAIEGVRLVERQGKNGRLYAVRLIWAENACPPFSVYLSDDSMENARVQQSEVAALLALPILEPELLDRMPRLW